MELRIREPVTRTRAITLMVLAVLMLLAGVFLLAMGVGYLIGYAVQGESAFKYFKGSNVAVVLTIAIVAGVVGIWLGQVAVRAIKPYLVRTWDLDILTPEQRAEVHSQLRQRRRWRFVVMGAFVVFIAGVVWAVNVPLKGSLNVASGIIGWIVIIVMIIGGVGWGVSSRRLKRARRETSLRPSEITTQ
jgi:hypothetical protein